MSHTQGKLTYRKNPWDEGKYDLLGEEKNSSGYAPLAHVKGDKRITGGNGEANARRLVACWNALDGVPTEWLENYVFRSVENVIQENAALKAENERLRKDAEEFIRYFDPAVERSLEEIVEFIGSHEENLRAALEGK